MQSCYDELSEAIKTSKLANGLMVCLILASISAFISAGFCFKRSIGEDCATFYILVPMAFVVLFVILYVYIRIYCEKKPPPQEQSKITVLIDNPMIEPSSPKRKKKSKSPG
jgi:hypothetical protein